MSSKRAKQIRKLSEKYIRKGEDQIIEDFVHRMKDCSFRTRLKIAWAIVKGERKK